MIDDGPEQSDCNCGLPTCGFDHCRRGDVSAAYRFDSRESESYAGELKQLREQLDNCRRNNIQLKTTVNELRAAVLTAREDGRTSEWRFVTQSWLRNLGGKVFHKAHFIDALAVTTAHLVNCHGRMETALCEIANLSPLFENVNSAAMIASEALKANSRR